MKRFMIRLSALVGVIAVGVFAIVQAQRTISRAEAREQNAAAEPSTDKPLAKTKTKNKLRSDAGGEAKPRSVANPFTVPATEERYANRYADRPPTEPPAGFDTTGQDAQPLEPTEAFPDAADVRGLAAPAPRARRADPFGAARDEAPSEGPAFGAGPSEVQLAGAEEAARDSMAEDRYAPGSIRNKPLAPSGAAARPRAGERFDEPAGGLAPPEETSSGDRYGNYQEPRVAMGAADETASRSAESSLPAGLPAESARDGFQDFRPLPGGEVAAGDEGTGTPGGKHLEGSQAAQLTLEKIAPAEIQVGKPAKFEIRVRNVGNATARNVEIHDETPQGTRLLSAEPTASQSGPGQVTWSIGALPPGEETTVSMEVMPLTEGEIGSVATVHFASEASARTICTRPQLTLDVQGPRDVLIGEDAKLSIKVSNPGTGVATNIVLSESIPEQLVHPAGPELEYEIGALKPGESRQLDLTLKAAKAGQVINRLIARGDAQLMTQQETEFTVVAPQLQVAVQGPKRRYLERPATYTMLVSNPGTAPAKEIELVTYLPKGLKFVEANNAGEFDPRTNSVHWLLEELPPNETGQVTLTTLPIEPGEQMLRLQGAADRGLSAEQEETIQIEGVAAILFQVLDAADPIEVGGDTTYEIRVVNQGSKAATNIQLSAELPAELKPLDAQGPTRHEFQTGVVLFEPLPRLAPKADTTYRLRVQGLRPGDLRVQIQLKTDEMETPVTKEESTHVYADE
ncbi:MAG TPA: hypothetical protein VHC19_18110 [Pirellulales bacterium]|nr:hypothetical protein [Pirellulales bacterium]